MVQICNSESIYKSGKIIQAWNSYGSRSGSNIFSFQSSVCLDLSNVYFPLYIHQDQEKTPPDVQQSQKRLWEGKSQPLKNSNFNFPVSSNTFKTFQARFCTFALLLGSRSLGNRQISQCIQQAERLPAKIYDIQKLSNQCSEYLFMCIGSHCSCIDCKQEH